MTLTEQECAHVIRKARQLIWGGFSRYAEVLSESRDYICPRAFTTADEDWIAAQVKRQWDDKKSVEAKWPQVTDCDRLDGVFSNLITSGILAMQNAGYTISQGEEDIVAEWRERGEGTSKLVGYTFYHGQDLEHVIDSGVLALAYGIMPRIETDVRDIALQIVKALAAENFLVTPPPDIQTRIFVSGLNWQKRSPAG
jgi:hypothetical protein